MSRPQTVSVDFDGVIHAYGKGWHDGTIYDEPVRNAIGSLRVIMEDYAVVIHSTREPEQIAEWLTPFGFRCQVDYDGEFWNEMGILLITNRKLPSIVYVDDRAIRFESWGQTMAFLHSHYPVRMNHE